MNWYDQLTESQETWFKNLQCPFGLLTANEQKRFGPVPIELIQHWNGHDWLKVPSRENHFYPEYAYRLDPNWQRPPKGHWEYCEVEIRHDRVCDYETSEYWFEREGCGFPLEIAMRHVGFDGFQFEHIDGWHMTLMFAEDWIDAENRKPATPKRVRFWVEK